MLSKKIIPLILLGTLALPSLSNADKWYHSPWFWGSAGVVGGGVVGYVLGRESARPYYAAPVPYAPAYVPAYAPITYAPAPPPASGGDTYYREKWAFPFYHKIESYPVRSTMPQVYQPASVSLASGNYEPPRNVQAGDSDQGGAIARDLTINVGNNNENVNINLGRHDPGNSVASAAATINPVYNNPNTVGSRVVDTTVGARVQPYVPVGEQPVPTADRNRAYRDLGTASDRVTSGTVTQ